MSGIYIHIPFCKQACHYCNFHFATSIRYKDEMIRAILDETELRKNYLPEKNIETIYFGGGTPSLLEIADLRLQIDRIQELFEVAEDAEITIEANPDDIDEKKLRGWKEAGINRLSIGIQSFFEEDLEWMNRAHTAQQAVVSLQSALKYFPNISVDLIYGTPQLTNENWKLNVERCISVGIPHLSCYALTVEPKTPLEKMIRQRLIENVNPDQQSEQFLLLMAWMKAAGYEHYEISNFSLAGKRSRHNTSYWSGKSYLGLGPSAHSFDGSSRQWNIANNNSYIKSISERTVPFEKEILTPVQQLNEYIMTSLRTIEGLDLMKAAKIGKAKSENVVDVILKNAEKYLNSGKMIHQNDFLILTNEGKLFADGIASELFF